MSACHLACYTIFAYAYVPILHSQLICRWAAYNFPSDFGVGYWDGCCGRFHFPPGFVADFSPSAATPAKQDKVCFHISVLYYAFLTFCALHLAIKSLYYVLLTFSALHLSTVLT